MAKPDLPFSTYIAALVLATAVPLVLLLGTFSYRDFRKSENEAAADVLRSAQLSAARTAGFLRESEEILRKLSQHPRLSALDSRQCGALLVVANELLKYHVNVVTRTAAGNLVCTAVPPKAGLGPPLVSTRYLRAMLRAGKFTVGGPLRSSITGTWVVPLQYPLRDAQGGITGAVVLALDLAIFDEIASSVALIGGKATRIISGDGVVIASSQDRETAIGRNIRDVDIAGKVLAMSAGTVRALDARGGEHIYGIAAVPGTDWRVVAGMPAETVFAQARRDLLHNALVIAAFIVLVALLSVLFSRRAVKSIGNIARAAAAVAAGDKTVRADPTGPVEIRTVAAQFNAMLDVLDRTEQRLSCIITSAMDPIITVDERQEIMLVNPAVEQMFGYTEAELLGRPVSVLLPERHARAHEEHFRGFARSNVTSRAMGRFGQVVGRRANGQEFPVDASISRMEWAGQRLFTVILRDVTRRIDAEKALRKNYELLDRIFATTHFCVVYLDRDLNFVRVNKAYADACGHPPEFFVGKNHFDLYPSEEVEAIFHNAVANGTPHTVYANPFEFPGHPERGVTYWDWTLHPLKNEHGEVEGLLFALLDVTERRRADETLRESELRLKLATQAANIGLWDYDLGSDDAYFSPQWKAQLGYGDEEIANHVVEWMDRLHPEDRPRAISLMSAAMASGRSDCQLEFRLRHKDGTYRWIHSRGEILRDAGGVPARVLGCHIDLTELKQATLELERKTALAQLLESLARAASEATPPREAMKNCLSRLCDFGHWTLGRVATTIVLSGDFGAPPDSIWHAADLARYQRFIRVSQDIGAFSEIERLGAAAPGERKSVWIADLNEAQGFVRRAAALADGLRAAFLFPVIVNDKAIAFLELFADVPRPVDSAFVSASETIASQIAYLIEHDRAARRQGQLAVIVDNSNDAILSCRLDRTILTWNAAAERMFGYAAAEIVGQDAFLLVPADQQDEAASRLAQLNEGLPGLSYVTERVGKNGRRVEVSGSLSLIRDESGNPTGVSIIFRDIGERNRAERARALLAAIVESSNDAILIRGSDRTILSWNAAAERLFGWSAKEAVGQSIDLIVPPERIGKLQPFVERTARGETLSPIETIHLRKDGERIATQVTFSPVRDLLGGVIAHSYTVRDMTQLRRSEAALRSYAARVRELSRRLQEVEETERHAIARELHDRIGQALSTLTLLFGKLGARLARDAPGAVGEQLRDIQVLLKATVEGVRDVMAGLRPPVLDDYGLHAALRQLAMEFARRSGIAVELIGADLQPRLPSIVETAMFRISQEALNNIAKHAQAKHVEISLGEAAERVALQIADDGVGFDTSKTPRKEQHWGMITMQERAELAGIALRLESTLGTGTRVVLEVERAAS